VAKKKGAGKKKAVKVSDNPRASESNPRGAGRRGFLGPKPRILPIPMRNEDRELIRRAAEDQGEDDARLVRRAIFTELRRLGYTPSGSY